MNYKIKANGNIEELISLFSALGCKYFNHTVTEKNYMIVENGKGFFCKLKSNFKKSECREISIDQLKDMVVLKRNDANDSNVSEENCLYDLYLTDSGDLYFYHCGKNEWILSNLNGDEDYYKSLKPITKEPIMKEYLDPENDYKFIVTDKPFFDLIEIPEGADTLAGDSSIQYFWKHGVGEKGNMIIGVGESLTRYSGWTGCKDSADVWLDCVNDDSFKIIWQRETQSEALPFIDDEHKYDPEDIRIAKGYDLDELAKEYKLRDRCDGETDEEYRYMLKHCIDLENYIAKETLNDKVASAEVARQEFIGAPFSDLPEVNFEAVDDFVESNVEQDNVNQPSHYNKGGVECIDAIQSSMTHEAFCGYLKGNVQKYMWRYENKGGVESLEKAQWYLNKLIEVRNETSSKD